MKKIFAILLLICMILLSFGSVWAEVQPADMVFNKDAGGKYIYCNNPEFITRDTLADFSVKSPHFLMNNEDLTPDNYTLFAAHVNHTDVRPDWEILEPGFDIELDVLFQAKEDTVLRISRIGFEVPENVKYYQNGEAYTKEEEWGCFKAWASYLGMPISQIDSGQRYEPTPFEPVTVSLAKGETLWLSRYIPDYGVVPYYRPVNLLADFEIVSGKADANVCALRANGTLGDRSEFSKHVGYGFYVYEHQHKGIADSKASVTTDLSITVDDSVWSDTTLPVIVHNQYVPEGKTVTTWYTNLNPRADIWNYDNVAEDSMLAFTYKDDRKLSYYGSNVPQEERENIWYFDTLHTDHYTYEKSDGNRASYKPNTLMPLSPPSEKAAALGNYGVLQNYNITATNNGMQDRYLLYRLKTMSNNLIILRDENGELIAPYPITKGSSKEKEHDTLASVKLPAQKTTKFTLTVILVANYLGGMENSLVLNDMPVPISVYSSVAEPVVRDPIYTGRDYIKWENHGLYRSDDKQAWTEIPLSLDVQHLFEGRYNSVSIVATDNGYMMKSNLYDGIPYYTVQNFFQDVYFFDRDFNLIEKKDFGAYPTEFSAGSGHRYVRAGSLWHSTDGEWTRIDSTLSTPVSNGSPYLAAYKNGKIHLSTDGETFRPVRNTTVSPTYIDSLGSLYYFTKGGTLYISENGVYFQSVPTEAPVLKLGRTKDLLLINDKYTCDIPIFAPMPLLFDGTEYIEYTGEIIRENNKLFVPIRSYAAFLGQSVGWNGENETVTIDGKAFSTTQNPEEANDNTLWLNDDTTYISLPAI